MDQALIRLEREYPRCPTKIVVMGVVPEMISRNQSRWKHFYEFGNILGFKPRFYLRENAELVLCPSPIKGERDFEYIGNFIDEIKATDPFYKKVFLKSSIIFPHSIGLILQGRALLASALKILRLFLEKFKSRPYFLDDWIVQMSPHKGPIAHEKLYQDKSSIDLSLALVKKFKILGDKLGFTPILLLLPMRDDLVYMRRGRLYYQSFVDRAREYCAVLDLAPRLLQENRDEIFEKWHYSSKGNEIVAGVLSAFLQEQTEGIVEKAEIFYQKAAGYEK